jgi:radical SAM superfamily enzyme YgiQ (UPF0313 family)
MRLLLLYANPNQSVPVSPYGLDAIRGILRSRGDPVETVTVNPFIEHVDPETHLRSVLAAFQPDLIGISIRNIDNAIVAITDDTPSDGSLIDIVAYAPAVRRLVNVVKEWNDDVACVVGGSGFTSCPVEYLRYLDLDHGFIGPAEDAFAQLVGELSRSAPPYQKRVAEILSTLPNAVTKADGGFRTAPVRAALQTEPASPPDIAAEYQLLYRLRDIPVAVRTKSGCPLRCVYCTDPVNLRRTDRRPIDHVIAELRHHVDAHGFGNFHIADAELNLPYEDHLLRLCGHLRDSGLADRIRWRGYFNVIPFSDDLVDAVVTAGCRSPSFAVDSFHDEGLRAHRKNFRAHHVHDVLNRLLAHGSAVRPEVCLLLGRPGETLGSIDENIRWMLHYAERGVQIAYSCGLRVYPNTPLAEIPLDISHIYLSSGRIEGQGTRLFTPGELLAEPVVYCEPLTPRDLVRYLAQRVGGHPNINIFADWPWPEVRHADELRLFNVGVHRMAYARFDAATTHLTEALDRNPDLTVARTALEVIDRVGTP